MMGGLYGDLPAPASSPAERSLEQPLQAEERPTAAQRSGMSAWSAANRMAPPTIRKASLFAAPPSVLKNQSAKTTSLPTPSVLSPSLVRPGQPTSSFSSPAGALPPRWTTDGATAGSMGGEYPSSAPADPSAMSQQSASQPITISAMPTPPPPQHVNIVAATSAVIEEYDPGRPNDYEAFCRERKRRKIEEDVKRELERKRQEEEDREKEQQRIRELERAREAELGQEADEPRERPAAISGEEAWKRRALLGRGGAPATSSPLGSAGLPPRVQRSPSPPKEGEGFLQGKTGSGGLTVGAGGQMTAAERMMAKMGWKAGQGLGKQEQGITTPLMARKTDKRAGVIVNATPLGEKGKDKNKENGKEREGDREDEGDEARPGVTGVIAGGAVKAKPGTVIGGQPTQVLLLRNMVGPGEVDDELEEEVAGECAKYGTVTRVLIFEITEENFSPTEAVRIFIQFERSESAMKALVDLDGRFFGGRSVRASFYDEGRFARNELAPAPGEVPSTGVA
eukprot:TRINITY_DN38686_c0_g1_i1.p1 TRINITY_DN38686_c0_g1~~TRINITY_DN38686_c0_g1_i1.p1  ORF type:complete len:510 (+),score=134.85 TRINITY_DN38686_c0_g1_i1:339-1868(+)